ncbi:hypothetical protein DFP72DRAFT_293570 [Ephemerocybe angulata]|uniref:Uncharacterized protein n=1 Tax=Ephemerocybe angulata TaxID=980116 RepID=A0A8H6M7R4_9AGAR|nr:hypothetical protein DFP72DRAFT_293570 [Tulosesus angulatus]
MGGTSPAAAPVASVTVVFAEGTSTPPSLSVEESVRMLAGLTAPRRLLLIRIRIATGICTANELRTVGPAGERARSKRPAPTSLSTPPPSISTSPPKTASWFAYHGRSKTHSASSASSTTRPGISQRVLDKRPVTHEEEGETDGLLPMMRITELFPGEGFLGGSSTGDTRSSAIGLQLAL